MDPITLAVVGNALAGIAEEMSAALIRTAYSPNIKERRDRSSALFTPEGDLVAQAENIPVHLGAMPFSVRAALAAFPEWRPGDIAVLNAPFRGGAHLPDITFVAPAFNEGALIGFVAVRAHHADVGGMTPGSLPARATEIYQEGLRIPPVKLWREGELDEDILGLILANVRTPWEREGDLRAQRAAVETGIRRLAALAGKLGAEALFAAFRELMDHAERRMRAAIRAVPGGTYGFEDSLDEGVTVRLELEVRGEEIVLDFAGSSPQVDFPVNAPLSVTASATYFALKAVLDPELPPNAGAWRPVRIVAPEGTVVNAGPPAPVGGGNLELSQRIVDVVLGALAQALPGRVPAASQGTMNNLTIGGIDPETGEPYTFYETIGGGMGARPGKDGIDGIHTHMTNTLNTPVEALELAYPLRVERYELREGSGGRGRYRGGMGIRRDIRVLGHRAVVSLLADRRARGPWGLEGGEPGAPGEDFLIIDGKEKRIPSKGTVEVRPDGVISIHTPGGGGYGPPRSRPAGDSNVKM
ncbi:hydantoinase B/oxoprolinase family protein [Candidatus Bipolaricaulota bacterium]|nr:hydantoinase B/oxoprolinase family protein [Candidatus Bipolaricaulota bacterium]